MSMRREMSLRRECPCDVDGICPYEAEYYSTCEYWCGEDEPEDYPEYYEDYEDYEDYYEDYEEWEYGK